MTSAKTTTLTPAEADAYQCISETISKIWLRTAGPAGHSVEDLVLFYRLRMAVAALKSATEARKKATVR